MENASKAIIMAGGLLIAMITISMFYYAFGRTSDMAGNLEDNTDQKELVAFNTGFLAYDKKLMYGADILSVLNKAVDNNKKYEVETYDENNVYADYYVNIVFTTHEGNMYSLKDNYSAVRREFLNVAGLRSDKNEDGNIFEFKKAAFKCSKVTYVESNSLKHKSAAGAVGRIKEMVFEPFS